MPLLSSSKIGILISEAVFFTGSTAAAAPLPIAVPKTGPYALTVGLRLSVDAEKCVQSVAPPPTPIPSALHSSRLLGDAEALPLALHRPRSGRSNRHTSPHLFREGTGLVPSSCSGPFVPISLAGPTPPLMNRNSQSWIVLVRVRGSPCLPADDMSGRRSWRRS